MALELSDTRTIKITHGTPHPIRADNARIIGMDEMLDRVKSIEYIKLDSSEPIGVIDKMIVTKDKIYIFYEKDFQKINTVYKEKAIPAELGVVIGARPGAERISEHQRYAGRHHPE